MANQLQKPNDPYSPLWVEYARQNPGLRRSLSAGDVDDPGSNEGGIDLSTFVPDTFKGEDGAYDTAGFRSKFDQLFAADAQRAEAAEGLPKTPEEYIFALSEDHQFPEGFDPAKLATTDADGNAVEFDPAKMIAADDPDVKSFQNAMHALAQGEISGVEAMQKAAGIMVNRELNGIMAAEQKAAAELAVLGDDQGKSRIDTVKRELGARLPGEQANALLDNITSADALRAVEGLIKKSSIAPSNDPGLKPNMDGMTNLDLIQAGLEQLK